MAQEFKYLFTPIRIRNKTAKNRIVSTAHGANFSPLMEENRFVEYNRAKAAGGCGLSIISSLPVSVPHGRKGLQLDTETLVNYMMPGLRKVADAYHDHGCLTTLQLASQGSESISWAVRANEIGFTPASFSATVGQSRMSPAHEMDAEEIEQYV
ncbi:MAG: hypothetical protein HYX89_04770, partial [Chloroflexi bacterium]|nr:hypothetical protein [Chloroflexota bacterium]